ncbi:MAG: dihydropteroate synthase [Prevotella sp.]|nr:dihydropteroate synthase [Prevotella sp.]
MDYTINVNGQLLDLSRPTVMGILNATPDSFFAGSRVQTETEIVNRAQQILAEGGAIIDIGAYSTRPGAMLVDEQEEMARLRFALTVVRREFPDAVLSIDTFRPAVARMAVDEYGASIINDVSGGNCQGVFGGEHKEDRCSDKEMFTTVARLGVPYILMSSAPTIREMLLDFAEKVQQLRDLGQKDIILDPGFGFGKTLEQNYELLGDLERLHVMQLPILVGVSRKSMIWKLLGVTPDEALNGTTVIHTVALLKGASILRVHDVREAVETITLTSSLNTHL